VRAGVFLRVSLFAYNQNMSRSRITGSYHTHCGLDDGHGTMEEIVLSAISKGFTALGFSCHTPIEPEDEWHMKEADFPYYLGELKRLKEVYRDRIELYTGLELDFLEGNDTLAGSEYIGQLDYTIASVHLMKHRKSGAYLSIDGPIEEFTTLLEDNFHGSVENFAAHYYALQERMISSHTFDILGHCDLIKKHNRDGRFFDPASPWYRKAWASFLHRAAKHDVQIEVNTGGVARGATSEVYPSPEMIRMCTELSIPLMLNSDAHRSDHLDFSFSSTEDLLIQSGVRSLDILEHGFWTTVSIL